GDKTAVDSMITDGLWCAFNDYHMGVTAENINTEFNQTRKEQDEFSQLSQEKAVKAQKEGKFTDEIISVEIPQRRGEPTIVSKDEEHTSELQSRFDLVCRLLLEKKNVMHK